MSRKMKLALDVLAALQVQEVTLSLNGGGDSGDCEIEQVTYADGSVATNLPRIAVGFDNRQVLELDALVVEEAAEVPDGDWINNEGGEGSVTLLPLEQDGDLRVQCAMEYRAEEYGDDDLDDPEDVGQDAPITGMASAAVLPVTVFAIPHGILCAGALA